MDDSDELYESALGEEKVKSPVSNPLGGADMNTPEFNPEDVLFFEVVVGEPVKHMRKLMSFVSYKMTVTTQDPPKTYEIQRRYNNFVWLQNKLSAQYPTIIIPSLPEGGTLTSEVGRFDDDFLENRKSELQKFLKRIRRHPALCASKFTKTFLEENPEIFIQKLNNLEEKVSMTQRLEQGLNALQFLTGDKTELDEFFQGKMDKLTVLETQLNRMAKATSLLSQCVYELSRAYQGIGAGLVSLSELEAKHDGELAKDAKMVGKSCSKYFELNALLEQSEMTFEASVQDYRRSLGQIKQVLRNRQRVLVRYHAAKTAVEKQQAALAVAPDDKKDKANADHLEAVAKFEQVENDLKTASDECKKEWERFDKTTLREIKNSFATFMEQNVAYESKVIQLWRGYAKTHGMVEKN